MRFQTSFLRTAVLLGLLVGCTSIERSPPREIQTRLEPSQYGSVKEFSDSVAERLDYSESGLLPLPGNLEALQWRLALTDDARVSIDAQYFLWHADYSGSLLLERLLDAADRGVRIRLLVDDIFLTQPDRTVASLSAHPNVDFRIFNPNPARRTITGATVRFFLEMRRLNRRMHNKLFIVDGHAGIIGGRNIGDSYFGLAEQFNFRDLDVLVTGEVLGDMADSFDQYWNSRYAYPGESILQKSHRADLELLRRHLRQTVTDGPQIAAGVIDPTSWTSFYRTAAAAMIPVSALYVSDHAYQYDDRQVVTSVSTVLGPGNDDIFIVTPYFIPDSDLLDTLGGLGDRGVEVKLLVPSLASINHTAVHGHYRRYRRRVIAKGIELYEYRHDPEGDARNYADTAPVYGSFISMHTKAVVSGKDLAYIGSLNFDPRAMRINTENGLIVRSEVFAGAMRSILNPMTGPEQAWRVTRDAGQTVWTSDTGVLTIQPARSGLQRLAEFLTSLLPIAGQL